MRLLTALLLPALLHAALRGAADKKDESLMDLMKDTLEESADAHPAVETHIETDRNGNQVKIEEQTNEDGTWVITASDVKDATAHAVDQTLVGKAEEDLVAPRVERRSANGPFCRERLLLNTAEEACGPQGGAT